MDFLRNTRKAPFFRVLNGGPQAPLHVAVATVVLFAYGSVFAVVLDAYELLGTVMMQLGVTLLAALVYMTAMFLISLRLKRTDIVDIAWGGAIFIASAVAWGLALDGASFGANVQTLVLSLVLLWALRLSFTMTRRVMTRPEDARYVSLRKKWRGSVPLNTYVRIFLLQGVLAVIVAAAAICAGLSEEVPISAIAVIGAIAWGIGFVFESVGDWQLQRFTARSKGRGALMKEGLWQYTRHPNYFGEILQWWGIFTIGLSVPFGFLGIVGPLVITYLLLFVSGVPTTERLLQRKAGWKSYKERTSILVPLPPRELK